MKVIKDILSKVNKMVLCTVREGRPWAATVFFAYDNDLNLYFFSVKEARHSRDIARNKYVAGAISSEHKRGLAEPFHKGLQFEGMCELVGKKNAAKYYVLYERQHPRIRDFHDKKDAGEELYKVRVSKWVLFDTSKNPIRREIKWRS